MQKMSQCTLCEYGGYGYEFSNLTADFTQAKQICADNGGALARYLDDNAYLELRKCCQNGLNHWIGLFENRLRAESEMGPYTWVGDTTCTGSLWNVTPLPNSNQISQAVTILLNSNLAPLDVKEEYNYQSLRYICQYPLATSTTTSGASSAIIVSTNDTTSSTIADRIASSVQTTMTKSTSTSSTTQVLHLLHKYINYFKFSVNFYD